MKRFKPLIIGITVLLALMSFGLVGSGCKKLGQTVNDLYKFPATKAVLVQVNVEYTATLNGVADASIDISGRQFILNAYALDAGGQQVQMGMDGSQPSLDLPITLTSAHTSLEVLMILPVSLEPGPDGYALRFSMSEFGSALRLDASETAELDAMRGDVKAGTSAEGNNVDLSIASAVAYRLVTTALENVNTAAAQTTYKDILALLKERQGIIENASVDTSATHSSGAYITGMKAHLGLELINDKSFQSKITKSLLTAVQDGLTDEATKIKTAQVLTSSMSQLLFDLAKEINTYIADRSQDPAKVFKADSISENSIPDPDHLLGSVFAPADIAFTDTDATATLGGNATVTPPSIYDGITSFNIYFGGEAKSPKGSLAGTVQANAAQSVSLSIAAGTSQPADSTRFWVYPVVDGSELDLPNSTVIVNLGGSNNPPEQPLNIAAVAGGGENQVRWDRVTGATGYELFWSTISPVSLGSGRIKNVTSPYRHMGLIPGIPYYYRVVAIQSNRQSLPSAEATATPLAAVASPAVTISVDSHLDRALSEEQIVPSGSTLSLTVTARTGYGLSKKVSGTCPQGSWLGNIYTIAAITSSCSLSFSSIPPFVGKLAFSYPGYDAFNQSPNVGFFDDDDNLFATYSANGNAVTGTGPSASGAYDGIIAKFNAAGTRQWLTQISAAGGSQLRFRGMFQAADGSIYACGETNANLETHAALPGSAWYIAMVKLDAAGNLLWIRQWGVSGSFSTTYGGCVPDAKGNIYIVGSTSGDISGTGRQGNIDALLMKIAPTGTALWIKQFGVASLNNQFSSARVDQDADVLYLTGYGTGNLLTNTAASNGNVAFVMKFDSSGSIIWQSVKDVGSGILTYPHDLIVDPSTSKIYLAAQSDGNLTTAVRHAGIKDLIILEYTDLGNSVTAGSLVDIAPAGSGNRYVEPWSIAFTPDKKGIIVAGETNGYVGSDSGTRTGSTDVFVGKFDLQLNTSWIKQFGLSGQETAGASALADAAGNAIFFGYSDGNTLAGTGASTSGNYEVFVQSYTPDGVLR